MWDHVVGTLILLRLPEPRPSRLTTPPLELSNQNKTQEPTNMAGLFHHEPYEEYLTVLQTERLRIDDSGDQLFRRSLSNRAKSNVRGQFV